MPFYFPSFELICLFDAFGASSVLFNCRLITSIVYFGSFVDAVYLDDYVIYAFLMFCLLIFPEIYLFMDDINGN